MCSACALHVLCMRSACALRALCVRSATLCHGPSEVWPRALYRQVVLPRPWLLTLPSRGISYVVCKASALLMSRLNLRLGNRLYLQLFLQHLPLTKASNVLSLSVIANLRVLLHHRSRISPGFRKLRNGNGVGSRTATHLSNADPHQASTKPSPTSPTSRTHETHQCLSSRGGQVVPDLSKLLSHLSVPVVARSGCKPSCSSTWMSHVPKAFKKSAGHVPSCAACAAMVGQGLALSSSLLGC